MSSWDLAISRLGPDRCTFKISMGAAVSIVADIAGSELVAFSKQDARGIVLQYVPVFREDIFDRYADPDGSISKEVLLQLVDKEIKYLMNMRGE